MKTCFSLEGKYIWDHWYFKGDEGYYKYFLQAPDRFTPDERHDHASVGCAFSKDLENWNYLGTIFKAQPETWFNISIWTGSVVKHNNMYFMFFTSRDKREKNKQRIGLAVSSDPLFSNYELYYENRPLINVEEAYYEICSPDGMTHWRDPFIYKENGCFYVLICARKNRGAPDGRGTVALATSSDMFSWDIEPPLQIPEWFGQCECPYIYKKNGLYYLHFCTHEFSNKFSQYSDKKPINGDYYLVSKELRGPYEATSKGPALFEDSVERVAYDSKIINMKESSYALFWAKENHNKVRKFTHISPLKLKYLDDGNILADI
ncbi:MAG: family 43 glycosylhydrolase [Kosmotoga sp.]|nr:MAG: family 43 glycosylhydrolase [Kosmotoga sp.]